MLHPGAGKPAQFVEPTHDLRIVTKVDRRIFFLEGGKAGIRVASFCKGEAPRIEAYALQTHFHTGVGVGILDQIDVLGVPQIARDL